MADYFDIGIVVKPQGIKGELRVYPVTDDPDRFALLDEVTLTTKGGERKRYAIEQARGHQSIVILKLAGVDDRNAAAALTGGVIQIPPEQALPLDEGEYYIRDLLGMAVWTDDGEQLGMLDDVLRTGANDVYVIKTTDQKELLIPAIKQCILTVSPADKKMVVHLLEGLRE